MYCRHVLPPLGLGSIQDQKSAEMGNSWHLLLGGMTDAVDTGDS